METMASSVVRREMVVFLQNTHVSTAPLYTCIWASRGRAQRSQALRTGDHVSLAKGGQGRQSVPPPSLSKSSGKGKCIHRACQVLNNLKWELEQG